MTAQGLQLKFNRRFHESILGSAMQHRPCAHASGPSHHHVITSKSQSAVRLCLQPRLHDPESFPYNGLRTDRSDVCSMPSIDRSAKCSLSSSLKIHKGTAMTCTIPRFRTGHVHAVLRARWLTKVCYTHVLHACMLGQCIGQCAHSPRARASRPRCKVISPCHRVQEFCYFSLLPSAFNLTCMILSASRTTACEQEHTRMGICSISQQASSMGSARQQIVAAIAYPRVADHMMTRVAAKGRSHHCIAWASVSGLPVPVPSARPL